MAKPKQIHTVESLLKRTNDVGQCKEWTGYYAGSSPVVYHEARMQSTRRLICRLQNNPAPASYFINSTCNNPKCVNPDHFLRHTQKQHAAYMASKVEALHPQRLMKLSAMAQVRRKLTDDQVRTILGGTDSCVVLAREFNVNKSLISKIRRGQAHRMTLARNNPFWSLYG
jgi:hypothetical protein